MFRCTIIMNQRLKLQYNKLNKLRFITIMQQSININGYFQIEWQIQIEVKGSGALKTNIAYLNKEFLELMGNINKD